MTNLRYSYQTVEFGKIDIHLRTLRDKQEFDDPEGVAEALGISSALWPLFGVIWPSSLVLANYLDSYATGTKRILEIGCGMALTSLLLNKKNADITASDYHPEVGKFLLENTLLNKDAPIAFERVDWSDENDSLGLFDLIIGSDILYEDGHIELLANFVEAHSKPNCEVIIVDPGRGRKNKFSARMIDFGHTLTEIKPEQNANVEEQFKGRILTYKRP